MKRLRYLLGIAVILIGAQAEAALINRLASAQPNDFTFEDDSREFLIDAQGVGVAGNNEVSSGDVLIGFSQIIFTNPPNNDPAGNSLYAVFSQTFDTVVRTVTDPGTPGNPADDVAVWNGTFKASSGANTLASLTGDAISAGAILAFYEAPAGFATDYSVDLGNVVGLPTMTAAIADIAANGIFRFSAGIVDTANTVLTNDYFAFLSEAVLAAFDPLKNLSALPSAPTTNTLGAFGAGLTVIDNTYSSVTFNDTVTNSFNAAGNFYGLTGQYSLTVSAGTFRGTDQNPGAPISPTNGTAANFINDADASVNATVVPEPTTILIWGGLSGLGLMAARRRRRA